MPKSAARTNRSFRRLLSKLEGEGTFVGHDSARLYCGRFKALSSTGLTLLDTAPPETGCELKLVLRRRGFPRAIQAVGTLSGVHGESSPEVEVRLTAIGRSVKSRAGTEVRWLKLPPALRR